MQQQIEQPMGRPNAERHRVEAIVETLANLRNQGETVAEVAHDARNMVTALGLYCDLLEEPGVLAAPFSHYGSELRLVAAASRSLVEKLVELDQRGAQQATTNGQTRNSAPQLSSSFTGNLAATASTSPAACSTAIGPSPSQPQSQTPPQSQASPSHNRLWDLMPAQSIENLAAELKANRNLLSSLAGPAIAVTTDTDKGAQPVRLTGEDLTRVLINLVKNACEALPGGGRIQIGLREQLVNGAMWLALTIEDNGPGIREENLEKIFESGFTTPAASPAGTEGWPSTHRGLGLAITRSIVELAGGRISAANRSQGGARFTLDLPVRW